MHRVFLLLGLGIASAQRGGGYGAGGQGMGYEDELLMRQQQFAQQRAQQEALQRAQLQYQAQQYAQQQQQQGGGFGNKGKPLSKKEQKKRESELKKKEAEQKKAFAARQKAFKQAHATASKRGGRDGVAKRGLLGRLLSFKGIALFSGAGYMFVAQRELLMTGLRVPIEVVSWVLRTLYSSVLGPLLRKLLLLLNGNRLPGGSY
jgi:hypothetical protein